MWILWMTSSLSSHSTSASVSELSRLVTHTAGSSPKCNSEKRPLSNSVAFQTLFKWHRYCGILKIHIVRKINTGIRYEPVYRPALYRYPKNPQKYRDIIFFQYRRPHISVNSAVELLSWETALIRSHKSTFACVLKPCQLRFSFACWFDLCFFLSPSVHLTRTH